MESSNYRTASKPDRKCGSNYDFWRDSNRHARTYIPMAGVNQCGSNLGKHSWCHRRNLDPHERDGSHERQQVPRKCHECRRYSYINPSKSHRQSSNSKERLAPGRRHLVSLSQWRQGYRLAANRRHLVLVRLKRGHGYGMAADWRKLVLVPSKRGYGNRHSQYWWGTATL